jgi:hypothetical protein
VKNSLKIIVLSAASVLSLTACARYSYRDAKGNEVRVEKFGFDTKVDKLRAGIDEKGAATLEAEGYDTQAKVLDTLNETLKVLQGLK